MKVGYLGPDERATYGYMAAREYFGSGDGVTLVPFPPPQSLVCTAVRHREVDYGVVAVENVIDGAVFETIRAMRTENSFGVRVCGEVTIPIEIFLLRAVAGEDSLKKVLSHQTAVRQCSRVVAEFQALGVEVVYTGSTGEAGRLAKDDPDIAVLGPSILEETFGLVRVRPDSVADEPDGNYTRFWVVGRQDEAKTTGKDKTAILVSLDRNTPGGLDRSLGPFATRGINLCFMFPIPIAKRQWEYTFLVEFEAHASERHMEEALEELIMRSGVLTVQVLGSYPNTATYS